jgi:hypothetical protein
MAALAGGSIPFLVALILFLAGVIIALYTRRGTGMDHHPYRHVYGGAPGAAVPSDDFSGSDRTSVTERDVARSWRRRRRTESPASVAARLEEARAARLRQSSKPAGRPNRLRIRSPVARVR